MENQLQEIFKLLAQSAELHTRAEKLGLEYTKANCPYKVGDRLIINRSGYDKHEWGIVTRVFWDEHSTIEGMAKLQLEIFTRSWERKAANRNRVTISDKEEILLKDL